jgi:hypothetical protein
MFASGVVKLTSGDESWLDWTALSYHYESQPLPTWVGWWVHQLPMGMHKATVAATFAVELLVPFLMFVGRIPRLLAFAAFVGLQVTIAATGNYGFFNLLTVVLCIPLLDDAMLPWRGHAGAEEPVPPWPPAAWARRVAVGAMLLLATAELVDGLVEDVPWPGPLQDARVALDPFRLTSSYGLFRVMTKGRPEIVVEGSRDGIEWKEYAFRWKPGDPLRAPAFLPPHMPRLDWQMWFAALSRYERTPWFEEFLDRLLDNAPAVVGLLAENPFPDEPPRFVRAMLWRYEFTTRDERRASGAWWKRTKVGLYSPVLSR